MNEIELRKILFHFVANEIDPCRFDHHGYCQEHGWFNDSECMVSVARRALGLQAGESEAKDTATVSEIELKGDAELDKGIWYADRDDDESPYAYVYKNRVSVYRAYGNEHFITPDTARSMASALLHFADKAEAWRESE